MALQLPPYRAYAGNLDGLVIQRTEVTLSMSAPSNIAPAGSKAPQSQDDRKAFLLAGLMGFMVAGGYQVVAAMMRPMLWALWAMQLTLIVLLARGLPLRRLMKPVIPFFIWYGFYCIWGVIVSPLPVADDAVKMVFYLTTIAFSLVILAEKSAYFRQFANASQFAALANFLIVLALLIFPQFQDVLVSGDLAHADVQLYSQRFAGLWGNANVAGLMALVIIALSVWATGSIAWVGRVSAMVLIYLTASRTAFWILVLLVVMLVPHLSRRLAAAVMLAVVPLLLAGALLTDQVSLLTALSSDQNIARMLDYDESQAYDLGKPTRLDLMESWVAVIERHPWIGNGLNTMSGGGSQNVVFRSDVPYSGIHNIFLGLWVDSGILGLVSYLIFIIWAAFRVWTLKCDYLYHWGIRSILLIQLIFSQFNHNMLSDMYGLVIITLILLLPASRSTFLRS